MERPKIIRRIALRDPQTQGTGTTADRSRDTKNSYPWAHQAVPSEVPPITSFSSPAISYELKVALILHLGPDHAAWNRIEKYVLNCVIALGNQLEILVTIANSDYAKRHQTIIKEKLIGVKYEILIVENRGMDVGPFLLAFHQLVIQRPLQERPDILLKIHSKSHDAWRRDLCEPLFGSPALIVKLVNYLFSNEKAGMLGSRFNIYNSLRHSGYNGNLIDEYLAKMKLPLLRNSPKHKAGQLRFVGGTIFMVKLEVYNFTLANMDLLSWYNKMPLGRQSDGTGPQMPHSLERILGIIVQLQNYQLIAV